MSTQKNSAKLAIQIILIARDGISIESADELIAETQSEIDSIIERGGGGEDMYEEMSETIADNLGLEPDYVEAFMRF